MPDQHRFLLSGRGVPNDDRAVFSRGGDLTSIGRIGDSINRAAMFVQICDTLTLGDIPYQDRAVGMRRNKPASIRRKDHTPDKRVVFEGSYLGPRSCVPQNDIFRTAGSELAVRRKCNRPPVVLVRFERIQQTAAGNIRELHDSLTINGHPHQAVWRNRYMTIFQPGNLTGLGLAGCRIDKCHFVDWRPRDELAGVWQKGYVDCLRMLNLRDLFKGTRVPANGLG